MIGDLFEVALPEKFRFLWNSWSIELLVLANFVFQVILTFNGSRRRHTPGWKLSLSVWFAYLLAAKVATVVLSKLTTIEIGHSERNTHTQVQALLAPLMLMQIGNPDTITAYSIEDNQLGVRQVFSMVIQVAIMFYILIRSWTDSKTSFLYLSMSVAGIIKYGETSWALKSALNDNFGFTVANFFKYREAGELFDRLQKGENPEARLPQGENELPQARLQQGRNKLPEARLQQGRNKLPEARLILRAYYRFCCLKPHLDNWVYYPPTDCDLNKLYIDECDSEEVFKITDSELGFMYDALYTKAPVIYTCKGLILRLISLSSLIATLCGFSVLFDDAFVYNIGVGFIQYALIASVILEIYQILRLPFTDWAIVQMIRHYQICPIILWSLLKSLAPQSATWKRWSNTMVQFNLLDFCWKSEHRRCSRIKILRCWDLDMELRKQLSLKSIEVNSEVRKLVVEELRTIEETKQKGEFTERGRWTIERYTKALRLEEKRKLIKELGLEGKGKLIKELGLEEKGKLIKELRLEGKEKLIKELGLEEKGKLIKELGPDEKGKLIKELGLEEKEKLIKELKRTILERPFDKSIFIWHITTNIFYKIKRYRDTTEGTKMEAIVKISNYMMYLLVKRSHVLSITTGKIIFDHACVKLGQFTRTGRPNEEEAYEELLCFQKESPHSAEKETGEQDKSKAEKLVVANWNLLTDVKELAKSLLTLSDEKRWNLMGSMWIEMLGYAASNCEMEYHSEHIRKGGELITHVWILNAHNVTKYSSYDYDVVRQDEETPATSR